MYIAILIGIILCVIGGATVYLLYKLLDKEVVVQDRPVPSITAFDPTKDLTTICPMPLASVGCIHDWDKLSEQTLDMQHEKKFILVLQCTKCGLLDKTMTTTEKAPPPPAAVQIEGKDMTTVCPVSTAAVECNHKWEVIDSDKLDRPHEQKYILVCKCSECGIIDKTITTTSKPPPPPTPPPAPPLPRSECRHNWFKEKAVTLDSPYEQLTKGARSGYRLTNGTKNIDFDVNEAPPWMFKKTYVCVRVCKTCGEIDKVIASNFEGEDAVAAEEEEE